MSSRRSHGTNSSSVARYTTPRRGGASTTPSEASSHADSIQDRLSIVQLEIQSRRSRQSQRDKVTSAQCTGALSAIREQFHDIEERIAIQASDHRAELSLLDNFIREALFKVEQSINADADRQFDIFSDSTQIVEEKIKELEHEVFQGDGLESEEEQLGRVRGEMNAAVEAARTMCEQEEEQAKRDLGELIEPSHLKIRNLMEMTNAETRQVEKVVEDTRGQLLQLAAPPQTRLEAKEREIARGLKGVKVGLSDLRQDREMTFATLYDALTQLSQELIKKFESDDQNR